MKIKINDAEGKDLLDFLYVIKDAFTVDFMLNDGKTFRDVPVGRFDWVYGTLEVNNELTIKVDEIESITINLM